MRRKNISDFSEIGFKRFLKKIAHLAEIAEKGEASYYHEEYTTEALRQYLITTKEGNIYVSFLVDKAAKYTIVRESVQIGKSRYEFYCSIDYETFIEKDLYRFYMIYDIVKRRIEKEYKGKVIEEIKKRGIEK